MGVKPIDYPDSPPDTPKEVPLSESLMRLKGHLIEDIKITENEDGLHVVIDSMKRSEIEPENGLAATYSHRSFLIPNDKCGKCIWTYTGKNEPIPASS